MFGLTTVTVSSYYLSVAAGLGSVGVLYLMLALAARQLHELQLRETASRAPDRRPLQAWLRAFSPIVISQDAFGTASLSRFQVLLFTLAAVGVYAYVLIRTGELSSLSSDVLWLLGITMAGSALASIAGGPVVSTGNRLWLLATGVLDNAPRRPRWHDLLGADGEIDVTRVQALAFSAFAAAALVANGPNDLERFEVPDTLKYLIGLSQAVYVAGKALPRDGEAAERRAAAAARRRARHAATPRGHHRPHRLRASPNGTADLARRHLRRPLPPREAAEPSAGRGARHAAVEQPRLVVQSRGVMVGVQLRRHWAHAEVAGRRRPAASRPRRAAAEWPGTAEWNKQRLACQIRRSQPGREAGRVPARPTPAGSRSAGSPRASAPSRC
ncbi:hypothetical protein ACFQU2_41000 [Siccirubricoccus deserti]